MSSWVDDEQVKALIDYDRLSATRDIAKKLDVSHAVLWVPKEA